MSKKLIICLLTAIMLILSVFSVFAEELSNYPDFFKDGDDLNLVIAIADNPHFLDLYTADHLKNTLYEQNNCSEAEIECNIEVQEASEVNPALNHVIALGNDCNNVIIANAVPDPCPDGVSTYEGVTEGFVYLEGNDPYLVSLLGATQEKYLLAAQLLEKYANFEDYFMGPMILVEMILDDHLSVYPTANMTEDTLKLEGDHSTTISTQFTVLNNQSLDINDFELEVSDLVKDNDNEVLISAEEIDLSAIHFVLNGLESKDFTYTVNIPTLQQAGTYEGEITLKHNDNSYVILPVELVVKSAPAVSVEYTALDDFLQGTSQEMELKIVNEGNDHIIGTYALSDFMNGAEKLLYVPNDGEFPLALEYIDPETKGEQLIELLFVTSENQVTGTYGATLALSYAEEAYNETSPVSVVIEAVNQNFAMVQEPTLLEVAQGQSGTLDMTITNNGNVELDLSYEADAVFKKGDVELTYGGASKTGLFTLAKITEDEDGTKTLTYNVNAPFDQEPGTYTAEFAVTLGENDAQKKSMVVKILKASPAVSATVTPTTSHAVPGETVTVELTLANTGNLNVNVDYLVDAELVSTTNDTNTVVVSGTLDATFNDMESGETPGSETVILTLNIPDDQAQETYSGEVFVEYVNVAQGKSGNVTVPINLVVEPINKELTVESTTSGAIVIDRTTGEVILDSLVVAEFKIKNTGNWPLVLTEAQVADLAKDLSNKLPAEKVKILVGENLDLFTTLDLAVDAEETLYVQIDMLDAELNTKTSGTYAGSVTLFYGDADSEKLVVPVGYTIGDASASVSMSGLTYSSSDDNDKVTGEIVITNDGALTLSTITVSTDATSTTITNPLELKSALAAGESMTVKLETQLDSTFNSGNNVKIGELKFESNKVDKTVNIYTNIKGKLEITKVKFAGDTLTSDGNTFDKELEPGDSLVMTVYAKNTFDEDIEIEDVEVEVIVKGLGEDEDDIDGDADLGDIKDGDTESTTIDWDDDDEVSFDADSGDHEVIVTVSGIDEDGVEHEDSWTLTVEVQRDDGISFRFKDLELSKETVTCGSSFTVYVDGESIGEDDKSNSYLLISSPDLFDDHKKTFDIGAYDDDDCDAIDDPDDGCNQFEYSKTFTVSKNTKSGTYDVLVKWYPEIEETKEITVDCGDDDDSIYDDDDDSDSSSSGSSNTGSSNNNAGTDTGTGSTESGINLQYTGGQSQLPSSASSAFATKVTDTTANRSVVGGESIYLALLLLLIVLVIGGIIVAAAMVLKK
ncbi:hypothetical protein HOK51_01770 [Candidatus Woesearchaeota archaeon]|jgi:uncharacterized membrane protein|nr:hypothetical protein [Candidatus Woesearchaeota archaeon]MBT6518543.1 hypothetical protein [Candidatus Woesearchaeota archaeon]MBT7368415.1 hypothetical protein [Candidatus Woesearchaeota archaeon]